MGFRSLGHDHFELKGLPALVLKFLRGFGHGAFGGWVSTAFLSKVVEFN